MTRGSSGYATYCFGEATLNGSYSVYPIVYGGPQYSTATNGSTDVIYYTEPFMGGDIHITNLEETSPWVVSDGLTLTGQGLIDCTVANSTMTCPTFQVSL
jgi:hypothetical protein